MRRNLNRRHLFYTPTAHRNTMATSEEIIRSFDEMTFAWWVKRALMYVKRYTDFDVDIDAAKKTYDRADRKFRKIAGTEYVHFKPYRSARRRIVELFEIEIETIRNIFNTVAPGVDEQVWERFETAFRLGEGRPIYRIKRWVQYMHAICQKLKEKENELNEMVSERPMRYRLYRMCMTPSNITEEEIELFETAGKIERHINLILGLYSIREIYKKKYFSMGSVFNVPIGRRYRFA